MSNILNWPDYKVLQVTELEHDYQPVAHIDGDVFNTLNVGGKGGVSVGIGATSDKTGRKCDDGQTYFRSN